MKNPLRNLSIAAACCALAAVQAPAATTADIIFVVDESGSMAGEHAWLSSMVTSLDAALMAAGVIGNEYPLIGYGSDQAGHNPATQGGHTHLASGTAAALSAAAGGLVANGGFEDGFEAIDFGFDNITLRAGAATNVILITDEDRDALGGAPTLAQITAAFAGNGALLNAVVNHAFERTSDSAGALGVDSTGLVYVEGAAGTYTTGAGAPTTGFGSTLADYVNLATGTGGAAWDLNRLRAGGNSAASFTNAFVDIKVQEIVVQPVPEPGSNLVLLGIAMVSVIGVSTCQKRLARSAA